MNSIFDTHAHYDDEAFNSDRDELLKKLPLEDDIFAVINAGADIESSEKAIEISKKYDYIYASVGIHPENIDKSFGENYLQKLENLISSSEKVVAIGEIGLDYHFSRENKEAQKELFENQIKLALKCGLPVMVHDREAHGDTMDLLKKHKPKGIVHCFSGSAQMAVEVINLGMYIGIGGVVTFKNAKNVAEVVKSVHIKNIVLETDAPYMAPTPLRGKRCDSSLIKYTAEKIAELKNMAVSDVLNETKKNAINLFAL